jgi:hypothetical protein
MKLTGSISFSMEGSKCSSSKQLKGRCCCLSRRAMAQRSSVPLLSHAYTMLKLTPSNALYAGSASANHQLHPKLDTSHVTLQAVASPADARDWAAKLSLQLYCGFRKTFYQCSRTPPCVMQVTSLTQGQGTGRLGCTQGQLGDGAEATGC